MSLLYITRYCYVNTMFAHILHNNLLYIAMHLTIDVSICIYMNICIIHIYTVYYIDMYISMCTYIISCIDVRLPGAMQLSRPWQQLLGLRHVAEMFPGCSQVWVMLFTAYVSILR